MAKPAEIKKRGKLNRRLGIKSSIRDPQKILAAVYLIWRGADRPSKLEYCDPSSNGSNALKIQSSLYNKIESYWMTDCNVTPPENFKELLEGSGLFTTQLEPLQVLLILFWKTARISFVENKPESAERTGGNRFLKKLEFTANMDLLDLMLLSPSENHIDKNTFGTLLEWLKGNVDDSSVSNSLKRHLTILSEDTWFKHEELVFLQEGCYESLQSNPNHIEFEQEQKGPLRVLNSVIASNLHLILQKQNGGISFKNNYDSLYINRVHNLLDIEEVNADLSVSGPVDAHEQDNEEDSHFTEGDSDFPRNLILYGAPGTGKSYKLRERQGQLSPDNHERVAFYSDYSYSQFVGGYRPVPVYIENEDSLVIKNRSHEILTRPGQPTIEYSFIAGPMLRMYVEAKNNPEKKYLLVIEELNRADAGAVFGDFFQLLDRKPSGESEYSIEVSKEAREYLVENNISDSKIALPSNLYIWATLNSADQGVFPIDTAFKRRWQFEYLPLNENEGIVDEYMIPLAIKNATTGNQIEIQWNALRKSINEKLSDMGIQEDLLIGPFFLTPKEMADDNAFKHKLLSYLRDDILRHQHSDFFRVKGTLGHIIREYERGENIFNFNLT